MQRRAVRRTLLALLLVGGLGTGYALWDTQQRIGNVLQNERDVDARLDRMIGAVADLGAAQQAYVAPGQSDEPWLSRTSALVTQLDEEVSALRGRARSGEAPSKLQAFAVARALFVKTDARARSYLSVGQELMAADIVFGEARDALNAMATSLRDLRSTETASAAIDRGMLLSLQAKWLAGAATAWFLGLLFLAHVPSAKPALPAIVDLTASKQEPVHTEPIRPPLDLAEAARVCTLISRVTNAAGLPALLARAATVVDATGMIVWLGAGDELFPVMAHGYDQTLLSRLGAIDRRAENATAIAWRRGEVRCVPGGPMTNGAVVAPMFGQTGCIGVLAAEVRQGREADVATRAITAMFAAQLSSVVAAWPATSSIDTASAKQITTHADAAGA
jgi:GAF domain